MYLGPRNHPGLQHDRLGMHHATESIEAVSAFAEATESFAAHGRETLPNLQRALAADPALIAAHAFQGLTAALGARPETLAAARAVRAKIAELGGGRTADETALVGALDAALARGPLAAADILDARLLRRGPTLLLVKMATLLRFLGGDAAGMRQTTAHALKTWGDAKEGYGFVLGCHAFALEEAGEFAAAERAGREAVERAPHDAWAIHAVAHVQEMTHNPDAGVAWLEQARAGWRRCNNFAGHVAWHLALFRLDLGQSDAVLELYDTEVRPERSEEFRDYVNGVSLLWRLRQHGVDVGSRWDELVEIARRRADETTLVFASLHRVLALLAAGEAEAARAAVSALEKAACGAGEQAAVARQVGVPLGRALLGFAERGPAAICGVAAQLPPIGGSHAQRDVFVRSLAMLAAERADVTALSDVMSARRRMKADDRFVSLLPVH